MDEGLVALAYDRYVLARRDREVLAAKLKVERDAHFAALRRAKSLHVVTTRKEHVCCRCGCVIKRGVKCWSRSAVVVGHGFTGKNVSYYWCECCKPIGSRGGK